MCLIIDLGVRLSIPSPQSDYSDLVTNLRHQSSSNAAFSFCDWWLDRGWHLSTRRTPVSLCLEFAQVSLSIQPPVARACAPHLQNLWFHCDIGFCKILCDLTLCTFFGLSKFDVFPMPLASDPWWALLSHWFPFCSTRLHLYSLIFILEVPVLGRTHFGFSYGNSLRFSCFPLNSAFSCTWLFSYFTHLPSLVYALHQASLKI